MVEFTGEKTMYGQFENNYKHGKVEIIYKKTMENKYTAQFKKDIEIKQSVQFMKR